MPVLAAVIGPMVLPQGESFFTTKSWIGTLLLSAKILMILAETPSVAYL